MKKIISIFLAIFIFELFAHVGAAQPTDFKPIQDAMQMEGVSGFIQGRVQESLNRVISDNAFNVIANAMKGSDKKPVLVNTILENDPELREKAKKKLAAQIKKWLVAEIKNVVKRDILGNAVGAEKMEEIEQIAARIGEELNKSFNEKIDEVASGYYDNFVKELNSLWHQNPASRYLKITDIRGSINNLVSINGISRVTGNALAGIVGDATVQGIRSHISKYEDYLPGSQLGKLKNSLLNKPFVRMPTAVYATILAASASTHFMRAYNGVVVDPYELKRAAEVVSVLIWQVNNKEWISLNLMDIGSLARTVAQKIGMGEQFEGLLEKIKEPVARLEKLTADFDKMLLKPVKEVEAQLKMVSSEIDNELKKIRDYVDSAIPEQFNGIPESWKELKKRVGMKGGVLGKAGDVSPMDLFKQSEIGKFAEKIKKDANDTLDTISQTIADITYPFGPGARIPGMEMPSINPAVSQEIDPVFLPTGEFLQDVTDFFIPGRGLDFKFTRIYRGHGEFFGELGHNWTHSYAQRLYRTLSDERDELIYIDGKGRRNLLRRHGKKFISPKGLYFEASEMKTGFELEDPEGGVLTFDDRGLLLTQCDRFKNCLTLKYDSSNLVSLVVDTLGREIKFLRTKNGLISQVKDYIGRTISYTYNDGDELIGIRTSQTTAYNYTDTPAFKHQITMIMDPKGQVYLKNIYDDFGRVAAQSYGNGPWMMAVYESPDISHRVWVSDARGITRLYEVDDTGHLKYLWRLDDFKNYHLIIARDYNQDGEMILERYPSGKFNVYSYGREKFRNKIVQTERHPSDGGHVKNFSIEREGLFGRPGLITNPVGNQMQIEYVQEAGLSRAIVSRRSNPEVNFEKYLELDLNSAGQPVKECCADGICTTYEYYSAGDPVGHGYLKNISRAHFKTRFEYDPIGNITAITAPDGKKTRFAVDAQNQIIGEEEEGFAPRKYGFDANDNLVEVKFDLGTRNIVQKFEYGELDRLKAVIKQVENGAFAITRYEYDAAGNLTTVTDPNGSVDKIEYDQNSAISCVENGTNSKEVVRECVERDLDGNIILSIDGEGAKTQYVRDGFGVVVKIINPIGTSREFVRDELARVVEARVRDINGVMLAQTRYEYDLDGNVIKEKRGLWDAPGADVTWLETGFAYDLRGNLTSVTNPNGDTAHSSFDALRHLTEFQSYTGKFYKFIRDAAGRLLRLVTSSDNSEISLMSATYNRAGLPQKIEMGREMWLYEYDAMGNLVASVDKENNRTVYKVDDLGRRIAQVKQGDGKSAITTYGWDLAGRLVNLTDPNGNRTNFVYDDLGRQMAVYYPDFTEERTYYDRAHRVNRFIDRNKTRTESTFDAMGNMLTRKFEPVRGVGGTLQQQFEYDALGRIKFTVDYNDAGVKHDDVVTAFVYDSLSRLTAQGLNDRWVVRSIDGIGRTNQITYPSGRSVYYTYDADGKMTAAFDGSEKMADIQYDAYGNVVRPSLQDNPLYHLRKDEFGRLSSVSTQQGRWEYEYDPAGNMCRKVADKGENFFETNNVNAYTKIGPGNIKLAYDANGNLILDGTREFRYDGLNRLKSVWGGGQLLAEYSYDVFHRRVLAKSGGDSEEISVWDGWQLVETLDEKNQIVNYAYGPKFGELIGVFDGGRSYSVETNELNSVILIKDKDGNIIAEPKYDPYGKLIGENLVSIGFGGHVHDKETGLIYMRHRYYDPYLARFITPDPIGYKLQTSAPEAYTAVPFISYHNMQGFASHMTFANRPASLSARVGVYPYNRVMMRATEPFMSGEPNLYTFASDDPTSFLDPLGLASLLLSRQDSLMYLLNKDEEVLATFRAANNTTNPFGNAYKIGSNGPAPDGVFSVGVPQFYSEGYREDFRQRFGLSLLDVGEIGPSYENGNWGKDKKDEEGKKGKNGEKDKLGYSAPYGRIKIPLGSPSGGVEDGIAYYRGIAIHGGRHNYTSQTHGCVRADDADMEGLVYYYIKLQESNDPITTLKIMPDSYVREEGM